MKKLIFALLIPCHLFACQACIYDIFEKIDQTAIEIIRLESCDKCYEYNFTELLFLYGRLDAYFQAISIIDENH